MVHLILPGKLLAGQRRHREMSRPVRNGRRIDVWAPLAPAVEFERRLAEWLAHEQVGRMPIMGGAAAAWAFYDSARHDICVSMNLDSDTFRIGLFEVLASTNADDDTVALLGSLTGQLAASNGYTQSADGAGELVNTTAMTFSGATATFDSTGADPAWTASGGTLGGAATQVATIWDDTPTSPLNPLLCWSDIDSGGSGLTIADGETLTVQINASGIFTITGA